MPDHEKALIIWVYLSKLKNSCFLKHYISFIVWFFLVYYFYEEKNLSLPHQTMNYFSQIIWNVSINFHFFDWFCSSEEKEACSLCWFCGSPALRLIACYIYSSNNNKSLTSNLIFRTQRQGIFASCEKRHKTSDLCFATQEDILVLNSILLFEGTSWILTWSNYYMVSTSVTTTSFTNFCHFCKIICAPEGCFCLICEKRFLALKVFGDIEFGFRFASLQCQKMTCTELWTEFSVFSSKVAFSQSYLFVNLYRRCF